MSRAERRALVERENAALPISQQCRLLAVSRSSVYRQMTEVSAMDRAIMALIDRQYLARPYYGSRRMAAWLATQGHLVNRKRVQRLMRLMGLVAIYQRPNTSKAAAEHKIYPYLLGGIAIERINQVWCSDVTYIRWPRGFSIWWSSWIGSAARCWRGDCPTRSVLTSVSRRSRKRSSDIGKGESYPLRGSDLQDKLSVMPFFNNGHFVQINVPGAVFTEPFGINNNGQSIADMRIHDLRHSYARCLRCGPPASITAPSTAI
jgi:putative transposase